MKRKLLSLLLVSALLLGVEELFPLCPQAARAATINKTNNNANTFFIFTPPCTFCLHIGVNFTIIPAK